MEPRKVILTSPDGVVYKFYMDTTTNMWVGGRTDGEGETYFGLSLAEVLGYAADKIVEQEF